MLLCPTGKDSVPILYWVFKSANSVENINTAESLQKNKNNLLAEQMGLHHLVQVFVWIIHLKPAQG